MANQPSINTAPNAEASTSTSTLIPPRQALLQNITTQSILINQLFTLLGSSSSSSSLSGTNNTGLPSQGSSGVQNGNIGGMGGVEQIYHSLQLSTVDLSNLLKYTYKHQEEYKKVIEKKEKVELLEKKVRNLIKNLENDRIDLEELVENGKKVKSNIEQSEKNSINVSTILSHSMILSKYSSAPISNLMSDIDKNQLNQPWPNEMLMRMGLLFQMSGNQGMGGIGKKSNLTDETKLETTTNDQPQPTIIHEEPTRKYDPNAVFTLDLNSDDSDDD
ncbi:uncharacterized protein L201_006142 [Kwoniella dendrophila CBS 6074]|uniref:Mediator of RNA polymerase II transcription subunit 4 n=1 Tax=Kwoniella dendrophila CBS 6074 TaxID=1295534 RepID=A0AAX4K301_9TREE